MKTLKSTTEYHRRVMLHRMTIDRQRTNRMILAIFLWHCVILASALVLYAVL